MFGYKRKSIVTVILPIILMVASCNNENKDTLQNSKTYETKEISYQSLYDECNWLEQFEKETSSSNEEAGIMFQTININGTDYDLKMTLGEFINKGWVVEEYITLAECKYKSKDELVSGFEKHNSKEKTLENLSYFDSTNHDTCKFLMYNPDTGDIIYTAVSRKTGSRWIDSYICGYEYYWNMAKEDAFTINGITKDMSQEQIDIELLSVEGSFVKAEYDNKDRIQYLYYTNALSKYGVRIKYNYRYKYSATQPYEKIITFSIMN